MRKPGTHCRDFLLTPDQRREQDRQGRMICVQGRERREIGRQTRNDELKELFGASDVLEAMLSDIPQAHAIWEVMLHQIAGRLGEQHLSAMPGAHDPCASVEIQTNVPLGGKLWFPGVQAHAHPDPHAFRPGMSEEEALRIYGSFDGIGGACKGHKKGLSRRIDLVTVPPLDCRTQQVPPFFQHQRVAAAQLLQQAGRPLDVSEEQRDRSFRKQQGSNSGWFLWSLGRISAERFACSSGGRGE